MLQPQSHLIVQNPATCLFVIPIGTVYWILLIFMKRTLCRLDQVTVRHIYTKQHGIISTILPPVTNTCALLDHVMLWRLVPARWLELCWNLQTFFTTWNMCITEPNHCYIQACGASMSMLQLFWTQVSLCPIFAHLYTFSYPCETKLKYWYHEPFKELKQWQRLMLAETYTRVTPIMISLLYATNNVSKGSFCNFTESINPCECSTYSIV